MVVVILPLLSVVTLKGWYGSEGVDIGPFSHGEGVLGLKRLMLDNFTLEGCGGLERIDFGPFYL